MESWFYRLGKAVRPAAQKSKWVWQSLTGDEADAIRAEYEAGRELAIKFEHEAEIDHDPTMVALLQEVGGRLARCVKNKERRFAFRTVQLPEPNAFALPGGFVFVTRSLLERCGWCAPSNERGQRMVPGDLKAEVAFILGHEMAHVIRGHAIKRLVSSSVISAAALATPVGGWMGRLLVRAGSHFLQHAYSQDQELEADRLGAQLAAAAGFNPLAAIRMLNRLKGLSASDGADKVERGSYFSSHPSFDVRTKSLERFIRK